MIEFDTIRASLAAQLSDTRAAHPRASARVLYGDDLAALVDSIRAAADQAAADDREIIARAWGGIVPNGYRGTAECDAAEVRVSLVTGAASVNLARKPAPKRAHGRGSWLIVRLLRSGQVDGRIVVSR